MDKICVLDGCNTELKSGSGRGWCSLHYGRWRAHGDPTVLKGFSRVEPSAPIICKVKNCVSTAKARELCNKHYLRLKKTNSLELRHKVRKPSFRSGGSGGEYMYIYLPEHPNAGTNGYIAEHRYIMSEYLGRPLLPKENVHHKNNIKLDNSIENLELWVSQQPPGARASDLVIWAREIEKRYGKDFDAGVLE